MMSGIMTLSPQSRELVERAQRGDRAAFGELVEIHKDRIEALIEARLGKVLRSDLSLHDVLQETLLKAFVAIDRFEWRDEDPFMRWIGTIAENVIRSAARQQQRAKTTELDSNIPGPDVSPTRGLEQEERFDRLQQALERLDPDSRQVIVLARIRGMPVKDVAKEIHRSPNATSILLFRALVKLKSFFGDTESLSLPRRRLDEGESDDER